MAFKQVPIVIIWEILRRWADHQPLTTIAANVRSDRKTVRTYIELARCMGLTREDVTPERKEALLSRLEEAAQRAHQKASSQLLLEPYKVEILALVNDRENPLKMKTGNFQSPSRVQIVTEVVNCRLPASLPSAFPLPSSCSLGCSKKTERTRYMPIATQQTFSPEFKRALHLFVKSPQSKLIRYIFASLLEDTNYALHNKVRIVRVVEDLLRIQGISLGDTEMSRLIIEAAIRLKIKMQDEYWPVF